jgi:hypothetical protein
MVDNTGRKTYRTAAGKHIDMEALLSFNEEAIAVGNNPVNARGDEIGPGGEVIRTSNEIVQEYYATNPNAVEKSQPVASITEDMIPDVDKQPATVAPAMSVEGQPDPEVSATPKKTPKVAEVQNISADPTHTVDEATQSALEKKIATAKKKAADKAKKAKEEEEAKLPKAITGVLDNLDLG